MISRGVFDTLGLLDEIFSPGSGEDIDYCIKAVKAGFEIHEVPLGERSHIDHKAGISISSYPIYHRAEATVHGLSNWGEIFSRNMGILKERYNKGAS
jgi:GT2 family glycosyltransferase